MNELIKVGERTQEKITSLELLKQINLFREQEGDRTKLKHKTLLDVIRDEFDEEIGMQKILPTLYKHPQNGQEYPMFELTLSQAKQVLVRESKFVRKAVISYIEKLENALMDNQPKLPQTYKEALKELLVQVEENEMCRRENDKLKLNYEKTNKELEAQKDLVKKYVAKSEKMRRLSISGKGTFVPEEGEIFLAEVPNKGIDLKVKALVSKDREACEKCCFYGGELGFLCWGVRCTTIDDETQLTFRRVSDGEI